MTPTVYLTNAGSVVQVRRGRATDATRACVGPRSQITIMAKPRSQYGETGIGRVEVLAPPVEMLEEAKAGWIDLDEYRVAYTGPLLAAGTAQLEPGRLVYRPWEGGPETRVEDGDTLTCSCGRAAAARGACHRVWAAAMLAIAGWRVVLDGCELDARRAHEVLALEP